MIMADEEEWLRVLDRVIGMKEQGIFGWNGKGMRACDCCAYAVSALFHVGRLRT